MKIYERDCCIRGIKEVEAVQDFVKDSASKLEETKSVIDSVVTSTDHDKIIKACKQARQGLASLDFFMEKQELEVRAKLFELECKHMLFSSRVELDEFKLYYEKEFEDVKGYLKDEILKEKFLGIMKAVADFLKRLKAVNSKAEI